MTPRGLTQEQRDAIGAALEPVVRAAWVAGREIDWPLLNAAYLKGRVDQERGHPDIPGVAPQLSQTTIRKEAHS